MLPSWCCAFDFANQSNESNLLVNAKPRRVQRKERTVKFAPNERSSELLQMRGNPSRTNDQAYSNWINQNDGSKTKLYSGPYAGAVPWPSIDAKPSVDGIVHFTLARPFIAELYVQTHMGQYPTVERISSSANSMSQQIHEQSAAKLRMQMGGEESDTLRSIS